MENKKKKSGCVNYFDADLHPLDVSDRTDLSQLFKERSCDYNFRCIQSSYS